MRYSEEMRLIFKGYTKDEIAVLKKAEEDEAADAAKKAAEDAKKTEENPLETDSKSSPDSEETIKKFEDYEGQIEALTAENKALKADIQKLNNHQTLGEPEKKRDASDVMSELFNFKKKEEK